MSDEKIVPLHPKPAPVPETRLLIDPALQETMVMTHLGGVVMQMQLIAQWLIETRRAEDGIALSNLAHDANQILKKFLSGKSVT